ncbi:hypothetical protein HK103_004159, partial [Boothiomyces macroporosus]
NMFVLERWEYGMISVDGNDLDYENDNIKELRFIETNVKGRIKVGFKRGSYDLNEMLDLKDSFKNTMNEFLADSPCDYNCRGKLVFE